MRIQLHYSASCGQREQGAWVLGRTVQGLGLRGYIEGFRVSTQGEAERYGRTDSPIILLHGRDIPPSGPACLDCRTCKGADGSQQGLPEVGRVMWALEAGQTRLVCRG